MTNPYGNKPDLISDASQWHELSFQISVDIPVDWNNVDLRKWVHTVARYTALVMAKSMNDDDSDDVDEDEDATVVKTLIMGIKAQRIAFVTDDELHKIIDEFED